MTDKKVVLVTGASRGIGLAAVRLLVYGTPSFPASRVVTLSRTLTDDPAALAREKPDDLVTVQGDVTSEKDK